MGDFSDKRSGPRQLRIPIGVLLRYICEARAIERQQPPRRFRPLTPDQGVILAEDNSLSTTRVRQRLCDLMGTDVIRLNDKRYFEKLSQRLQEEYETVMDKQEEQRSAAEKQRMRRLMLEGILDNQDDYRAVLHGEHKHRPKKKKKKTLRKNTAGNEGQRSNSPQHSDEDRKKEVETQIEVLSRPSSGTQPEARTSDHSRAPGGKSKHGTGGQRGSRQNGHDTSVKHKNEMYVRPPHHDHARSSTACSTHRKSRRVQSASARLGDRDNSPDSDDSDTATDDSRYETMSLPPSSQRYSKFSRHEPERVRELRSTETVAGLYSIAEELVTVGAANETPTRKVSFKGK